MVREMKNTLGILAAILCASLALASTALAATVNSTTLSASVGGATIPIYLYKPDGKGPFPLIILSHGSPRLPDGRLSYGPKTLKAQALAFVDSGAAAAVVIRRGYGGNGKWVEGYKTDCSRPDYHDAGLVSAQDIDAAIKVLVQEPDIDHTRVVLVGHSAGAFASVAAATREKILGVVSFAAGRGSLEADKVTCEDKLVQAMQDYGRASRVPELWIYSQNDHFFGPRLANELRDAFVKGGGKATLISAPPYKSEGHGYIFNISGWKPEVDTFLKQIGFFP